MNKIYLRAENGIISEVSLREGLAEVNHAMMDGKREVRVMNSSHGCHRIEYKDGRTVSLVEAEAPVNADEPEETSFSVHVVSVRGGKVHTAMPGLDELDGYPLCRGGGMNQMLTQFRVIDAPLSCRTCITYEDRRAGRTN